MQKKVLSEIGLYYGDVDMPKGFEIDRDKLQSDILKSQINNKKFPFSKEWDKLNTYLREHINVEYGFTIINKETWGNVYKPKEISIPLLNINPTDLRNSPDYVLCYMVSMLKTVVLEFTMTTNRRAGRSWDIPLKNNKFIMFPSMQMYYITNNQKGFP
jgi:hypothetical protein